MSIINLPNHTATIGTLNATNLTSSTFSTSSFIIKIGSSAGTSANADSISVGRFSGNNNGVGSICIGYSCNAISTNCVSIGNSVGNTSMGASCIGIGDHAMETNSSIGSIGIGYLSANSGAGNASISIGYQSGKVNIGTNSLCIGKNSGFSGCPSSTIVLNCTGIDLSPSNSGFYVGGLRFRTTASTGLIAGALGFDAASNEIFYVV